MFIVETRVLEKLLKIVGTSRSVGENYYVNWKLQKKKWEIFLIKGKIVGLNLMNEIYGEMTLLVMSLYTSLDYEGICGRNSRSGRPQQIIQLKVNEILNIVFHLKIGLELVRYPMLIIDVKLPISHPAFYMVY